MEVVGWGGAVGHDVVDVDELLDGELLGQLGEVLGVIGRHLQEPAQWTCVIYGTRSRIKGDSGAK